MVFFFTSLIVCCFVCHTITVFYTDVSRYNPYYALLEHIDFIVERHEQGTPAMCQNEQPICKRGSDVSLHYMADHSFEGEMYAKTPLPPVITADHHGYEKSDPILACVKAYCSLEHNAIPTPCLSLTVSYPLAFITVFTYKVF